MRPTPVQVLDSQMYLDDPDILDLSKNHMYEPQITKLTPSLVKPGYKVLDIGGHIGYYTLMFSKLVGPTGRVYAFEPNINNFNINSANLDLNKITNVILTNAAVSNKDEPGKLFISPSNTGDHRSFFSNHEPGRITQDVQFIKMDDFTRQADIIDKIDFIKVDVQGSELYVVQGMKETLTQSKNVKMITEFWPFGLKQAGVTSKQFIEYCLSLGFRYKVITRHSIIDNYPVDGLLAPSQDDFDWGVDIYWYRE